ncbi:MAG: NADPH-dependent 7-cyano-7-deazaguanine reductase QueF [Moraxellaceae bacterium]
MSQVEHSSLGQITDYPTTYAPEVLFPIARAEGRAKLPATPHLDHGVDWWHVFELSWLDHSGKPQVGIGRIAFPASAPNLIESKSLKLYFNSLNFTRFADQAGLIQQVEADLSRVAGAAVQLQVFAVNDLPIAEPQGICLDDLPLLAERSQPDPSLLRHAEPSEWSNDQQLYSHLLRSNCPVTNQPDWGTIFIRYSGRKICPTHLLAYIISFRRHNGFHEQCVEQIFADLWQRLQPQRLMVYATYTRRGGLDINPCRSSDPMWLARPIRLARQ